MGISPSKPAALSRSGPFAPIVKAMSLLRMERSRIPGVRFRKTSISPVSRTAPPSDISAQQ